MKLSELIVSVRDLVQDSQNAVTNTWTDAQLTRFLDDGVKLMFRWQAERDESYYNHRHNVLGSAATQIHSAVWSYRLPKWVFKVRRVQETKATTESPGTNYLGSSPHVDKPGWRFDTDESILWIGATTAPDLTFHVAKIPAPLHQGTCAADGSTTTLITQNIPNTPALTDYRFESEADAYVGAIVEVTGAVTGGRDPVCKRRVIASARTGSGANRRIQFTVATNDAFPSALLQNDTYEMHGQVSEAHTRLLVLLASRMAFERINNVGALEATAGEFGSELKRFIDSCAPRDDGLPGGWVTDLEMDYQLDPDRDFLLGRYGLFTS